MTRYKKPDVDFTSSRVTPEGRKSNLSMFMVMLGFTFFSASMWAGQELAAGLNLGGFIKALILGGVILGAYTGALGFIGAKTGLTLDMLAHRSFGRKGSWLPSAMISFTQMGWFGVGLAMFAIPVAKEFLHLEVTPDSMPYQGYILVAVAGLLMTASAYYGIKSLTIVSYIAVPLVGILGTVAMVLAIHRGDSTLVDQFAKDSGTLSIIGGAGLVIGSFVSGGTATPNFARFSKSGKIGCLVTVVAFFLGNSLMFFFGAVSSIYAGGNDIFEVMLNLNLFYMAVLILGLNIWTTNDNALYSSGLGLSNIFGWSKKTMVLIAGIIGTLEQLNEVIIEGVRAHENEPFATTNIDRGRRRVRRLSGALKQAPQPRAERRADRIIRLIQHPQAGRRVLDRLPVPRPAHHRRRVQHHYDRWIHARHPG